ncbi:MAG: uracil-DNA glycosylase [Gammaproteobacteria bacterium]|jgi:DNA polymerase|nr:uracil-DNA glycosylase [Gammaproteobacteria bacterium]
MSGRTEARKIRPGPRQQRALDAMGVQVWVPRAGQAAAAPAVPAPEAASPSIPVQTGEPPSAAVPCAASGPTGWTELRAEVAACTRCELHRTRTQAVFGTGSEQARWLVIGEAPGADEDRQGEPFVGRAGQLLTEMLRAVGLSREQVFIANILKCRPPENRDPKPEEAKSCESYLQRQIALLQPRLILAVGRIAAQNLLQVETPIGQLRGRAHAWGPAQIPVVVTYHPAYLLRSPGQKARAWDDLCLARSIVAPV